MKFWIVFRNGKVDLAFRTKEEASSYLHGLFEAHMRYSEKKLRRTARITYNGSMVAYEARICKDQYTVGEYESISCRPFRFIRP